MIFIINLQGIRGMLQILLCLQLFFQSAPIFAKDVLICFYNISNIKEHMKRDAKRTERMKQAQQNGKNWWIC